MPDKGVLQYKSARDIAYHMRSGVFAYLVIFGIIAVFTPYFREHALFVTSIGGLLVIATIGRAICSWSFEKFYNANAKLWYAINTASTLSLALAWGILSMMSIYHYRWEWTTMVTCLSAAAFSAGIVIAFSINYGLTIAYLLTMFVPTLIMTVALYTSTTLIATFLFGTYLIFLVLISRQLNNEYWCALRNSHLLKERARELEMKNAELEALAYSISHDLRTPLRSLDGFSELLDEDAGDKLNDIERDYLQRIRKAAQHMGVLIDDLLKLSRISRAEFSPRDVDLSVIVQENIEKLRLEYPERDIEIEIEPGVKAHGDTSLLDIALNNLISNAWKYSANKEHSKIRFATTRVNNQIAYYVKDNGVGFDVRYVKKLFNPFQRLHHRNEYPGTGIGLATVKRIVQRHGGRVWANGKVDRGATFYFTIEGDIEDLAEV
jgi:signal transduction histidine kinase